MCQMFVMLCVMLKHFPIQVGTSSLDRIKTLPRFIVELNLYCFIIALLLCCVVFTALILVVSRRAGGGYPACPETKTVTLESSCSESCCLNRLFNIVYVCDIVTVCVYNVCIGITETDRTDIHTDRQTDDRQIYMTSKFPPPIVRPEKKDTANRQAGRDTQTDRPTPTTKRT